LHAALAQRQFNFAQHFRAFGLWPDDEELAAFSADVEFAIGQDQRRLLNRAQRLSPELTAGFDVESLQPRSILNLI
jgi:hypothetical protein